MEDLEHAILSLKLASTALALAETNTRKYTCPQRRATWTQTNQALEPTLAASTQSAQRAESSLFKGEPKIAKVSFLLILNLPIEPLHINLKKNVPGPGTYGYGIEINKYGVYGLSTIENSRAAAWSPSKKRFMDDLRHKRDIPGPGDYDPSDQIGGTSQYLLSNFKSYGTRKYMPNTQHSSRGPAPTKSETPGPGTYQAPSDFGYLELNKPTSPRSPGRTARTATILSSRGGARRNSLMSHRNS